MTSTNTQQCAAFTASSTTKLLHHLLKTLLVENCYKLVTICRCLTGGMVTLANTSMSGMCSMAHLLFPEPPVKGVDYEDVAVSLVKALHSNTDAPSTWARPGDWCLF
jgi:hypothetical protein